MSEDRQSMLRILIRLWKHISSRRKGQFILLLFLMIFGSFTEILSVGAIIPFLAVLTAPEQVFFHSGAQPFIQAFRLTEPKQLLLPLTIIFGLAVLFAGSVRLLLLWINMRVSFATGAEMSLDMYRRTLYQSYEVHIARNSSLVVDGIANKANNVIYITILPILSFISSIIIMIGILIALVYIDPLASLSAFGGFVLIYFIIIQITRKRLFNESQTMARESTNMIKYLQEGLGGIRDVLIDGSQKTYCESYQYSNIALRRAQGAVNFISSSPRIGVEAIGILLMIVLSFVLARESDGFGRAIPILGALALGAQRVMPVMQQAFASWATIQSGKASLQDTLDLLDQPLPEGTFSLPSNPLPFNEQINLKQLSFRYSPESPSVLNRLDLTIEKGSRVGLIGTTGSGKSTLIDNVMGLLQPSEGVIEIDGVAVTPSNRRAWQAQIAHVPQTIFLTDRTIEENIAFGVPVHQINHERVKEAARDAQISDVIDSLPKKYQTFVGERGIRLSGGQRQRIGIARALYKQAKVIIFDEATSALDGETEQAVMQAIQGLDKNLTLLIVAHRLTTLKNCNKIVELDGGSIKRSGTYQEIVEN
jgi:ATP-binding cassette subfamily B protein